MSDTLFRCCVDIGTVGTFVTTSPAATFFPQPVELYLPSEMSYYKIPSKIILRKSPNAEQREIVAIGYRAEDLFSGGGEEDSDSENSSDDERDDDTADARTLVPHDELMLFSNFKKRIIDAIENPPPSGIVDYSEMTVAPDNGGCDFEVPLVEILTKYMRAVCEESTLYVNNLAKVPLSPDRIEWTFAVPAIWDEYSKQMVKECAHDAGLTNVKLANEAEMSSTWFLQERTKWIANFGNDDGIPLARRTRCLIFDCGGGTTDCAYHQIQRVKDLTQQDEKENDEDSKDEIRVEYEVSERFPSVAKPFGAMWVDQDFEEIILLRIFGRNGLDRMRKENAYLFVELWRMFLGSIKLKATPRIQRRISLPTAMKTYFDGSIADINERLASYRPPGAASDGDVMSLGKIKRSGLVITPYGLEVIHERVLAAMGNFVQECFDLSDDISVCKPRKRDLKDYVVFCGGFSKSLFLQEYIKARFSESEARLRSILFFGERPECAVGVGGLYPQHICEYKSRAYYGFQFNAPYNPLTGGDPEGHVTGEPPNQIEHNLFQMITRKYETYQPGKEVLFSHFSPSSSGSVTISIYKTEEDTPPRYVDEHGCKLALRFDVPANPNSARIVVKAVLQAGSIEMFIDQDGMETKCQLTLATAGEKTETE